MVIELGGDVVGLTYKNGSWAMEVELKQDMPDNGFRALGKVVVRISREDADEISDGGVKFVKILVEVAK